MLERISRWDYWISHHCLSHRFTEQVAKVARIVSHTGDGHLYLLLFGLLAFVLPAEAYSGLILPAFAIELACFVVLKKLFKRDRPQALPTFIVPSDQFSFPSGHSAAAFVMASCIQLLFPAWAPLAFLWAALVACSRVLLGVHFISDVIAGACLGMSIVYLVVG